MLLPAQSFQDSYEAAMAEMKNIHYAPSEENDIQLRVLNIDGPVRGVWNDEIRNFILHRLKQSTYTAEIIGRSVMYAPFIEKALQENEMPAELFYLCLVESQFNTRTVSHAGAAGLWQLMPETARLMGLKVNGYVDERFDPYKATEAAVKYLKYLHTQLNDWGLAIAGYNMGPGRISNLIKEGKGTTYWELRNYLPKETQNYVPAFIASNYLMQYYPWHNIRPVMPNLDLQLTGSLKLTESISFATVSQLTEVPTSVIQALNPAYRKDFLPENPDGNYLILPKRVLGKVEEYIKISPEYRPSLAHLPILEKSSVNPNTFYERLKITIGSNDNLFNLADAFNCSPSNIRFWNSLPSFYVSEGQELRIFQPKSDPNAPYIDDSAIAAANAERAARELAVKNSVFQSYRIEDAMSFLPPNLDVKPVVVWVKVDENLPPSEVAVLSEKNLPMGLLEDFENEPTIVVLSSEPVVAAIKVVESTEIKIEEPVAPVVIAAVEPLKTAESTEIKAITVEEKVEMNTVSIAEVKTETMPATEQNKVTFVAPTIAAVATPSTETNVVAVVEANTEKVTDKAENNTESVKIEATKPADITLIAQMEDKKLEQTPTVATTLTSNENQPIKDEFLFKGSDVQDSKTNNSVLTITSMAFDKKASSEDLKDKIKTMQTEDYVYHFLGRNETLSDVAEKYEGVCVSDILALNQFNQSEVLAVGAKIKVKMP
jgi:membrane-bound lytic murein transglycosylase D